jgi:ubiquinone/menaquinone biosynthesis C-methylase UbiE
MKTDNKGDGGSCESSPKLYGRTDLGAYVRFVQRYPDVFDSLLSIWNAFDLEALKLFIANLDLDRPWETTSLKHKRYVENRETIARLLRAPRAHSGVAAGYLPREHVKKVYSSAAGRYDQIWDSVWTYENRQALVAALEPKAGERILEVGVGTGNNVKHFPESCEVTGIDFSRDMLDICRGKLNELGRTDVRLLEMDAHALRFADAEFDKVLCFYTLCTVEDPFQVLTEVARVSAPGGRVVIYDVVLSDIPEVALLQYLYRPVARELGAIYLEFCPPGSITYDSCLDLSVPIARAGLETHAASYFDPFRTVLLGAYDRRPR